MNAMREKAYGYLLTQGRELRTRSEQLEACTTHLMSLFDCSRDAAELEALHALAELDAGGEKAYVDVAHSTREVVVVRRPGRTPLALMVRDLVGMAETFSGQPLRPAQPVAMQPRSSAAV